MSKADTLEEKALREGMQFWNGKLGSRKFLKAKSLAIV